jgi:hypothetical protein
MHFLARIAIADHHLFLNLMRATATLQKTENHMYEELLEIWFTRVSSYSSQSNWQILSSLY